MSLNLSVDLENMYSILQNFPQQIREAIEIGKRLQLNKKIDISNIVYCGMGGSAISGDFVKNYLRGDLKIPIEVVRNYTLPGYVDEYSLVILVSYSGNTEETISCFNEAVEKKARVVCVSSDGKIKDMYDQLISREERIAFIEVPKGYPPRTAFGYLFVPLVFLLNKMGYIPDNYTKEIEDSIDFLDECAERFDLENSPNYPYELALSLMNRIPIIYGVADSTDVIARRWTTQFSENSKILAYYNSLPEMNHNEIVGWENLKELLKNFNIVFLKDSGDHDRIKLRQNITKKLLVDKNDELLPNKVIEVNSKGNTLLERWLYLVYLGDFISWYIAIMFETDPTPVHKIDILKKSLSQ